MRIARGRVDLVVTEQLPDHRQALAKRQSPARKGASKALTMPDSRLSRLSASWKLSGATPSARMRKASLSAAVPSSRSQMSRGSNSPRLGGCAEQRRVLASDRGGGVGFGLDVLDVVHDCLLVCVVESSGPVAVAGSLRRVAHLDRQRRELSLGLARPPCAVGPASAPRWT